MSRFDASSWCAFDTIQIVPDCVCRDCVYLECVVTAWDTMLPVGEFFPDMIQTVGLDCVLNASVLTASGYDASRQAGCLNCDNDTESVGLSRAERVGGMLCVLRSGITGRVAKSL